MCKILTKLSSRNGQSVFILCVWIEEKKIKSKKYICGCAGKCVGMALNSIYGEPTRGAAFIQCKRFNCFMLYLHLHWHTTHSWVRIISAQGRKKRIHEACMHITINAMSHIVCFKDTVSAVPTFICGLLNHLRTAKMNHILAHALVKNKPPNMHLANAWACTEQKWRKTCGNNEQRKTKQSVHTE